MTPPLRPPAAPATGLVDLLDALALNAVHEDAGQCSIAGSVALLHQAGLMLDDGLHRPEATATRLMHIGAVNLSLGRLWEGHVNALALLRAHASPAQHRHVEQLVLRGALLGVWGADDARPVTWDSARSCLSGAKILASGLGTVTHAIITVTSGPGVRLALVDASDPARADASTWQMPGMRATASGRFDCDGLTLPTFGWIGGPGDYLTEPHFVGGVWRIAALQLGAALGLLETAAATLRARDRLKAEAQKTRLATQLTRALAAAALVRTAAQLAATPDAQNQAAQNSVATSIAARLLTEELGLDTIRAVEQSLGLGHFAPDSATLRRAQDLSVYMRQAARDAMLMRLADHAFATDTALWDLIG